MVFLFWGRRGRAPRGAGAAGGPAGGALRFCVPPSPGAVPGGRRAERRGVVGRVAEPKRGGGPPPAQPHERVGGELAVLRPGLEVADETLERLACRDVA